MQKVSSENEGQALIIQEFTGFRVLAIKGLQQNIGISLPETQPGRDCPMKVESYRCFFATPKFGGQETKSAKTRAFALE
jgi:hypothetical protein